MIQPTNPETALSHSASDLDAIYESWRTSEKYLIGAVLSAGIVQKGSRAFAEAIDGTGIQFTDFYSRELSAVWYVMDRLYQDGKNIDVSTIWAEMQKSTKAKQHISLDMILYLSSSGKAGAHRTHAENIVDASVSASINNAMQNLQPLVNDPKIKATEKLRQVHKIVTDLSKRVEHATKSQTVSIVEGLQSFLDDYATEGETGEIEVGIPTGFAQLDAKIDGWKKRTLNVIAGPPGSGKTVMLMNCALHAVMNGKRVLMVQLELPADQSFRRLLCSFSGIDSNRLKRHQLTAWEAARLPKAVQKLKEYDKEKRFTLLTMNQPTLEDIRIKLDTLMLDGYDIVFFDYAGGAKITRSHPAQNDLEHHREIYKSVDDWKKRYNIPVVVGAQYGAPQPQTHAGAYTMDMIYSSKFIKHNADTIMYLHPEKQGDTGQAPANTTQFVIVKNRDGEKPYGSNLIVTAKAEMNMFRFTDPKFVSSTSTPKPMWEMQNVSNQEDLS